MQEDDRRPAESRLPHDSRHRTFLLVRDWIDAHRAGISTSLYLVAGASLWLLKRSVRDYRVNRIHQVADIPDFLLKRHATLKGVIASVEPLSGLLYFYHVPMLHRFILCFLPLPILVPRPVSPSSSAGSHKAGGKSRGCSEHLSALERKRYSVLASLFPSSSASRSLLPLRLHSVDFPHFLAAGHTGQTMRGAEGAAGVDWDFSSPGRRGGQIVEEGDLSGRGRANPRSAEDVVFALKEFLDAHLLQQRVAVTLIHREERLKGCRRGEDGGDSELTGEAEREDDAGNRRNGFSSSETLESRQKGRAFHGPRRGDAGRRDSSLSPCATQEQFEAWPSCHVLRVRMHYFRKGVFNLRRFDLEEELLRRGLAVVARERLREEQLRRPEEIGTLASVFAFFKRRRAAQRLRQLEALEAKAKASGLGIWAVDCRGECAAERGDPASQASSGPSASVHRGRTTTRMLRTLVSTVASEASSLASLPKDASASPAASSFASCASSSSACPPSPRSAASTPLAACRNSHAGTSRSASPSASSCSSPSSVSSPLQSSPPRSESTFRPHLPLVGSLLGRVRFEFLQRLAECPVERTRASPLSPGMRALRANSIPPIYPRFSFADCVSPPAATSPQAPSSRPSSSSFAANSGSSPLCPSASASVIGESAFSSTTRFLKFQQSARRKPSFRGVRWPFLSSQATGCFVEDGVNRISHLRLPAEALRQASSKGGGGRDKHEASAAESCGSEVLSGARQLAGFTRMSRISGENVTRLKHLASRRRAARLLSFRSGEAAREETAAARAARQTPSGLGGLPGQAHRGVDAMRKAMNCPVAYSKRRDRGGGGEEGVRVAGMARDGASGLLSGLAPRQPKARDWALAAQLAAAELIRVLKTGLL
ncbi:hypothetical protein BESB_032710 [Besnoitia besnoiti]|uniref:TNase-like domain-containing protein n=1 Tax=Besnoitia besnoiti TaxID=94643 RepID=A0A2A9M1F4_BESBE|nr:uncharacterized protein BESB_032710 [Besnoitia besnoiti]PFH31074.1 hypothetical protein BESB_032710 [Besnoitia besnoiti]